VHELVVTTVPKSRGQKSDKADAYQRAEELLRGTIDRRVFKSPQTYARLRELARSHRATVRDRMRVQARLKTVYRSRGIPSAGPALYGVRRRSEWFEKLPEPCKCRALHLYTQFDFLVEHERTIEAELLLELSKHRMAKILQTCPGLGPIRVARLLPIVITPHRFRTRQQFWSYCGLGIVMRSSSDWVQTPDKNWQRAWIQQTRGLSKRHNAELKAIFKGAATTVIMQRSETPMKADYRRMLENGTKPNLAKLTLARKIAATALRMWKDEEVYHSEQRNGQRTRALDS
jgi:transposase